MKKISYWAKHHVWQSRLLIVTIYILLFGLGLSTGKLLRESKIDLSQMFFIGCIVGTVVLWILYPEKSLKHHISSSAFYVRRKLFDFLLGSVTFLMILYVGNNWKQLFLNQTANAFSIVHNPKDSSVKNNPLINNFIESINAKDVSSLSQKEKLRIIKKQLRTINNDKETSKGDKTGLIILSVIIALGLLYGLAALSCSIECSGSGGLALLVALGGTLLIIVLLVLVIKRITKGKPKKEVDENNSNKTPE